MTTLVAQPAFSACACFPARHRPPMSRAGGAVRGLYSTGTGVRAASAEDIPPGSRRRCRVLLHQRPCDQYFAERCAEPGGAGAHQLLPADFYSIIAAIPLWLRATLALVVGELGYYWGRRLSHEIPFLWRFHAVHHSAREMDFLVSSRGHPVDLVFRGYSL